MSVIYVMRHGQSLANVDPTAYDKFSNEDIPITNEGAKQLKVSGNLIAKDQKENLEHLKPAGSFGPLAIFSSPYHRCYTSAKNILNHMGTDANISTNLLLSEMSFGDQEGCDVERFDNRPLEAASYKKMGPLHYKPARGESLLDIHTRMGLFVTQQQRFVYIPVTIIVSHGGPCLMMHYFLTGQCPDSKILKEKCSRYWPNALVRKYNSNQNPTMAQYQGILGDEHDDILVQSTARP